MKYLTLTLFLIIMTTLSSTAQSTDEKAIQETIIAFAKAADNNDASALEKELDNNFRVIMNRLFGSKQVNILERDIYIEKIKNKEFGGDKRSVSFDQITLNGNTASVKTTMKGSKSTLISLLILVKSEDEKWKIVSDTPIIK